MVTSFRAEPSGKHAGGSIKRFNAVSKEIPAATRLDTAENTKILAVIKEAEVLHAVTGLSRHKAKGPDRLNNEFYKDTQALMVPAW